MLGTRLAEASFAEGFREEDQTVWIYTLWRRPRGAQDAWWLPRCGVVPVAPGLTSRR